ncbi:MAG: hypothetical protein WCW01_05570 [Gammaproteobacteria bacterium]
MSLAQDLKLVLDFIREDFKNKRKLLTFSELMRGMELVLVVYPAVLELLPIFDIDYPRHFGFDIKNIYFGINFICEFRFQNPPSEITPPSLIETNNFKQGVKPLIDSMDKLISVCLSELFKEKVLTTQEYEEHLKDRERNEQETQKESSRPYSTWKF